MERKVGRGGRKERGAREIREQNTAGETCEHAADHGSGESGRITRWKSKCESSVGKNVTDSGSAALRSNESEARRERDGGTAKGENSGKVDADGKFRNVKTSLGTKAMREEEIKAGRTFESTEQGD
jgi:hypothetical protein